MTEMKKLTDNIFFSVIEEDVCEDKNELDLTEMLNEIYESDFTNKNENDDLIPQIINYKENFTVKELFLICEYYGMAKEIKINKYNKEEIIQFLVIYESNPDNSDIVFKRQNMWFYMNELKNDKFMKKYVLW
jgi:hypothetical protein